MLEYTADLELIGDDRLRVALVQAPAPAFADAQIDAPRAIGTTILASLLAPGEGPGPLLAEQHGEEWPTLVLMPELSLGSGDWTTVNDLVKNYPAPLVLFAGIGYFTGRQFKLWRENNGEGGPQLAVAQTDNFPDHARLNGGCVWVRHPKKGTDSVLYIKNFLAQTSERPLVEDLRVGTQIMRLSFKDLTVFPLVCSDLVCALEERPEARIKASLAKRKAKLSLVAGILWDGAPHNKNWPEAIKTLVRRDKGPGLGLLANTVDRRELEKTKDLHQVRRLTGGHFCNLQRKRNPQRHGRFVEHSPSVFGTVVRRVEPVIAFAEFQIVPTNVTAGTHTFFVMDVVTLDQAGRPEPRQPFHADAYEAVRVLRTVESDSHASVVSTGLKQLEAHLNAGAAPVAASMCTQILAGSDLNSSCVSDPDHIVDAEAQLKVGFLVVGGLWRALGLEPQASNGQVGQLRDPSSRRNLLVWFSSEKRHWALQEKLIQWAKKQIAHPSLVVVGDTDGGGSSRSQRLWPGGEITVPTGGSANSITEAKPLNVEWRSLQECLGILQESDAEKRRDLRTFIYGAP